MRSQLERNPQYQRSSTIKHALITLITSDFEVISFEISGCLVAPRDLPCRNIKHAPSRTYRFHTTHEEPRPLKSPANRYQYAPASKRNDHLFLIAINFNRRPSVNISDRSQLHSRRTQPAAGQPVSCRVQMMNEQQSVSCRVQMMNEQQPVSCRVQMMNEQQPVPMLELLQKRILSY